MLSFSLSAGTIAGIAKGPGDAVAEDETIAQIETDKVTIDVRAPRAGTIVDILVRLTPYTLPGVLPDLSLRRRAP